MTQDVQDFILWEKSIENLPTMINIVSSTLPPSQDTPKVLILKNYQPILLAIPHTPIQTP